MLRTINSSKDIADTLDSMKRELVDIYRHKRNIATSIDCSIYIDSNNIPRISYTVKEYVESD